MKSLALKLMPIFLFTLSLALMVDLYLQQKLTGIFFNADSAFLPELYRDLLIRGHHLGDWYLPPAPSFFPDWFFYAAARFLAGDWFLSWPLFGILQISSLVVLTFLLLKKSISRQIAFPYAILAGTWLTTLALLNIDPYFCALLPIYHFGSLICVVLGMWFIVQYAEANSTLTSSAFCLLIFLISASDRLFLMQFIGPLVAVTIVDRKLKLFSATTSQGLVRLCVLGVVSSVFGVLIYELLIPHPTMYGSKLSLKTVSRNVHLLGENFLQIISSAPLAFASVLAFYAIGAINIREFFRSPQHVPEARKIVLVFSIAVGGIVLLGMTLLGSVVIAPRYWIPLVLLPLLFLPVAAPSNRLQKASVAIAAIALLFGLGRGLQLSLSEPVERKTTYYPEFAKCLDQLVERYGLTAGLGWYWAVKPARLYTRSHVEVATFWLEKGELKPFNWITSGAWIQPRYDFALVSMASTSIAETDVTEESLIKKAGPPDASEVCGDHKVLIYKKNPVHF